MKYKAGQLVINPKLGLGKVISVRDDYVTVYFKDRTENPCTINVTVMPMELAPEQSDPALDNTELLNRRMKSCETKQRAAKRLAFMRV